MIVSFKHRGLKEAFLYNRYGRVPSELRKRVDRVLNTLNWAKKLEDINNVPRLRLHPYAGKRKGTYSVDVNGPWRITFRWDEVENGPADVNLEQPH